MSNATAARIAGVLAAEKPRAQPRFKNIQGVYPEEPFAWEPNEPGLESPFGQRILENLGHAAGGYAMGGAGSHIAAALAQKGLPAMQALGQAGAIFPEGGAIPNTRAAYKELEEILPEAQKAFLRNKNLANWHAQMQDFPAVLKDKWALLKHAGGSN